MQLRVCLGPSGNRLLVRGPLSLTVVLASKDLRLEDRAESGAFPPARIATVRQWRFPTLFISGAAEEPYWHLVADSLVKWMPAARKVVIPGGGHGVHFDDPARFNDALLAFLREIPPRK